MNRTSVASVLARGGIAVIPTDTLYGIVASARDTAAVRRLYRLRRRTARKPFVVLISSVKELAAFDIMPSAEALRFLKTVWPGKLSVILSCSSPRFAYLRRGAQTLAFRVPRSRMLQKILRAVGPLVAPSANPEGGKPAETVSEARRYFGNRVDFYQTAGRRLSGEPSTIISLVGKTAQLIRQGAVRVSARNSLKTYRNRKPSPSSWKKRSRRGRCTEVLRPRSSRPYRIWRGDRAMRLQ